MRIAAVFAGLLAAAAVPAAQHAHHERLASPVFDVTPPTARIAGSPGAMTMRQLPCRTLPLTEVRRRIVDVAVQEWAFFGFPVRDEVAVAAARAAAAANGVDDDGDQARPFRRRGFPRLDPDEAARVATSIAGYWSVTPEAVTMIGRQNASWREADAPGRADPWSAAFISWVMCEAGLGSASRFQRAIAHHTYIDQSIRARQGSAPQAAFAAYDAGEAPIAPGDLLCAARRPVYRTLAERRQQMGVGARTHCDVVVKVDDVEARILAIGGNVGRAVSLKVLQAFRGKAGHLQPASLDEGRPVFAHLKLRAASIEANAFDASPTLKALHCAGDFVTSAAVTRLVPAPSAVSRAALRC